MPSFTRRVLARHGSVAALAALAIVPWAQAQEPSSSELDLETAATLAVLAQPLLQGLDAQARAARASGVSARQLPDPQLRLGIADVPANGDDAGSFTRDPDTRFEVGLAQEFPRAEKRRLRGESRLREAQRLDAEQRLVDRTIRRDAALAWLDVWRSDLSLRILRASQDQADTQRQLVGVALKTGGATQAEYLAASLDAERMQDQLRGAAQTLEHARNALSRWIGEAAYRGVASTLPDPGALPSLDATLAATDRHPQLQVAAARRDAARTGTALARAAYRPDWRLELAYADRRAYSESVTVQVGIDLPLFPGRRQDPDLAAALAQADSAETEIEDARRQLRAEARLNHHDAERLVDRLQAYDTTLLPQSQARIEASFAGWRSGRGQFRDVSDARRAALELELARLELRYDLARHRVQLTYLGALDPDPRALGASP